MLSLALVGANQAAMMREAFRRREGRR